MPPFAGINSLTDPSPVDTVPDNAEATCRRIVVAIPCALFGLLAAAAATQDEPAGTANPPYYVQGTADGTVHVHCPTGALPRVLPVPVPANGGSFAYRVLVVAKPDGSHEVSVASADPPPPDLAPAATFKIAILAAGGCRLKGDGLVAGGTTVHAALNAGGGSFRCGKGMEALTFAFRLPSGDELQLQTLSIQARAGVVETAISTPTAAQPPAQDQTTPPPIAPEPAAATALPFDLIALTSVADIGTGDAVWGYGLGVALRLTPYDAVHAHVVLRWRCFSTSIREELGPKGGEEGSIHVGADGESPLPDPAGGEGGDSSISILHSRVEFCLVDAGLSFDVAMASWIRWNVHLTAGVVQGGARGDRFVQTAGVGLASPMAGGMFCVGWSAIFAHGGLRIGGEDPLGAFGAWTAGWQVRF